MTVSHSEGLKKAIRKLNLGKNEEKFAISAIQKGKVKGTSYDCRSSKRSTFYITISEGILYIKKIIKINGDKVESKNNEYKLSF